MSFILKFEKQKLIYFAIPKSANSSIKHWLFPLMEIQKSNLIKTDNFSNIHQQVPWNTINKLQFQELKSDYLSFTVIRNPWERTLSVYKEKILRRLHKPYSDLGITQKMSLLEYAEFLHQINDQDADVHMKSQWIFINHKGQLLPDMVFDIKGMKLAAKTINGYLSPNTLGEIPKENQNTTHNYSFNELISKSGNKNSNTEKFNELIADRYKQEIRLFGYQSPYK